MSAQEAQQLIHYLLKAAAEFSKPAVLGKFLSNATVRDYLIFNLGHHIEPSKMGDAWRLQYQREVPKALRADYGVIPSNHVYFQTTCVHHFWSSRQGDYNTPTFTAGGTAPFPDAQ